MSSKAFKNKPCVYCGDIKSQKTADHVIARAFFLEPQRHNPPKVPSCESCNNEKSKLEHYLATVMPFGNQQIDALMTLQPVESRLRKNLICLCNNSTARKSSTIIMASCLVQ